MSAVLERNRKLTKMEFYKVAIQIRQKTLNWMHRDFGTRKKIKVDNKIIKIKDAIANNEEIQSILDEHHLELTCKGNSEYPSWYLNFSKEKILKKLDTMISYIVKANSIFPSTIVECKLKRRYQSKAIAICEDLINQFFILKEDLQISLEKIAPLLELYDKEIGLLKGWRQSNNKLIKKIEKENKGL